MKFDGYTKIILTVIAVLLGVLVLDRGREPKTAIAQVAANTDPVIEMNYDHVTFIPRHPEGFYMLDRRTGNVWSYFETGAPDWRIRRAASGRIEKPGDLVQEIPLEK